MKKALDKPNVMCYNKYVIKRRKEVIKMSTTELTREQLIKKKEQLERSLNEVMKTLDHLDRIAYKGKFEKAIFLLKELLDYLVFPVITIECNECGETIEVELDTVISELENLCRLAFKEIE